MCLREGLGQKYGAPRRGAQERLRTELTRDEKHAEQLEGLLTVRVRARVRVRVGVRVRVSHLSLLRCWRCLKADYLLWYVLAV